MRKLIPFLVSVVLPFLSVDTASAADLAGQRVTVADKDHKGPEAPKKLDAPKSTDAPELKALTACLKTEYFDIYYDPKYANDAEKEKQFLQQGIESLKKEFASYPVEKLLKVPCRINLYPEPSCNINEGLARISSNDDNGGFTATIELLTPSNYKKTYRNSLGLPWNDDLASKLVMHEYSTILLDQISRQKKSGVRFHSCPTWFEQGYEEYCGLMLSAPANRTELLRKHIDLVKKRPERIDFVFGVQVENDYNDGVVLLLYMNETYGKERVQGILSSPEPTFGKAAMMSLGVELPEFGKRFRARLDRR